MSPLSNIAEDHELYPVLKQVYDDLDRVEDAIANIGVLRKDGRVSLDIATTQGIKLVNIGLEEFACVYSHDNAVNTTFSAAGTSATNNVKVDIFNRPGPQSGEIKGDHNNNHILIKKKGIYNIRVVASIESTGAGARRIGFHCKFNGSPDGGGHVLNSHTEIRLSGGAGSVDLSPIAMIGMWELKKDDKLEVWCWNETNTNTILISDITLSTILLKET